MKLMKSLVIALCSAAAQFLADDFAPCAVHVYRLR